MPGQASNGIRAQVTRHKDTREPELEPVDSPTLMCTQIEQLTADCLIKSAKRQKEQKTRTGKKQIIGKLDSDFDSNFDLVSIAIAIAVH